MLEEIYRGETASISDLEYVHDCPACKHSDPELELALQAFARLIFDIYLQAQGLKPREKTPSR